MKIARAENRRIKIVTERRSVERTSRKVLCHLIMRMASRSHDFLSAAEFWNLTCLNGDELEFRFGS